MSDLTFQSLQKFSGKNGATSDFKLLKFTSKYSEIKSPKLSNRGLWDTIDQ